MKRLTSDIIFNSENRSHDLAKKSVRGGVSTIAAQGIQFILRLGGVMILARLLTPTDYGLIGMVMVIVNFAQMFKDAGLSMATVQKEHISHAQISTLFWLNVLISGFLTICILFCSPLVSWFYERPELTPVTSVLSISFILSGLGIQHQALLRRHMKFGMLACITIVSQLFTLTVTIVLAYLGWRYWALVGGTIAQTLASTLLTFYFCPWIPSRMRRGTGVRDMLKFGGNLTGFNFANYFSNNADNMLIGAYIGANALGVYTRAYTLFMMPITQIRDPLCQVAMPALSSLSNQPKRYLRYYLRLLDYMASLTMPLAIYCALEANFLIRIALGPKWLAVVPVFRILAVAGVVRAIAGTRGLVMMSCGLSKRLLYFGVFSAILNVTSFAAGIPYGIEGVAAGYAVANYVILVPSLFYCFRGTPISATSFMKTLFPPLLTSCAAGLGMLMVTRLMADDLILSHILSIISFLVIYFGLSWMRSPIRETTGLIIQSITASSQYGNSHNVSTFAVTTDAICEPKS